MDILESLNRAVEYIESHLTDDIDMAEAARLAMHNPDGFQRLFSYLAGTTLTEYIRHRRLTLAAQEMQNTDAKIIDVAVKFGYDSADSFSRAFTAQHGITPSKARLKGISLKIYPPISFHIMIKGAKEMDFKIVETEKIELKGLCKQFSGTASDRFEQEHIMWVDNFGNVLNKINTAVSRTQYGIWDKGVYWIAADESCMVGEGFSDTIVIEPGAYAVFKTRYGGFSGDELPKLRELIFNSWLPTSGYRQTSDYEVEVYYLYPKTEKEKRHYEIWVPIEKL